MGAILLALVGGGALTLLVLWLLVRSPLNTGVGELVEQPIAFDHRHHVRDDGIDCRYCHFDVERSAVAGVPPAALCMGCHSQIWSSADMLEPVRRAYYDGTPLRWARVNNVPDFVFFDHAVHVRRGVGCVTCHGRVDQMTAVVKAMPLTMGWCLDCHRDPAPRLRPPELVTAMDWQAPHPRQQGEEVIRELGLAPPEHCSGCHR